MEILDGPGGGTDLTATDVSRVHLTRTDPSRTGVSPPEVPGLDLDDPGGRGADVPGADDSAATGGVATGHGGPNRRWLAPLSPEALGITGLTVGVAGAQLVALIALSISLPQASDLLQRDGLVVMAIGGIAAVLGGLGIHRLPPESSSLSRGVTGAALLIGILLAALGGFLIWQSTGMPPTPNGALG